MSNTAEHVDCALKCPQCGSANSVPALEFPHVPIIPNTAYTTAESALAAPRSSISLASCGACRLLYNARFDEKLTVYCETYGNALHYSETFQRLSSEIATRLAERLRLRGKLAIEIGCGAGYFLNLLCETAQCDGIGFDPSITSSDKAVALGSRVKIAPEAFAGQQVFRQAALVCCRQVLEHFPDPLGLLIALRRALGADSRCDVFFEVPNAEYMLERNSFWDLTYEHCFYYSPHALSALFRNAGFFPTSLRTTFGDQYIELEASACAAGAPSDARLETGGGITALADHAHGGDGQADREADQWSRQFDRFASSYHAVAQRLSGFLQHCRSENKRVAVWGAGAKGIMFLNLLGCPPASIPYVVDVSPVKHGKFICGAGQEIVPPETLAWSQPDYVLLMNGAYREEVRERLSGVSPRSELIVV